MADSELGLRRTRPRHDEQPRAAKRRGVDRPRVRGIRSRPERAGAIPCAFPAGEHVGGNPLDLRVIAVADGHQRRRVRPNRLGVKRANVVEGERRQRLFAAHRGVAVGVLGVEEPDERPIRDRARHVAQLGQPVQPELPDELILPFVLQSAEVMKRAVAQLENYLDRIDGHTKGKVVIATVFGDVHDIGKSLVNTILTNNGYTVVDLGKQVPVDTIIDAAVEHNADAIGLSALLVSTSKQMPAASASCTSAGTSSRC